MPQENRASPDAQFHPVNITAIALRSAGHLYDLQVSATRTLLQTQARAAAAFGLPDWSPLFDSADERVRNVFATGAEQVLNTARQANEAVTELQRHVGRVLETQTTQAAESWQRGLEQLGSQASEGFSQLRETARRTADDAQRGAQVFGQQFRDNVQRAGEEARSQQQQGNGAAREASSQIADAAREVAQQSAQPAAQGDGKGRPKQPNA